MAHLRGVEVGKIIRTEADVIEHSYPELHKRRNGAVVKPTIKDPSLVVEKVPTKAEHTPEILETSLLTESSVTSEVSDTTPSDAETSVSAPVSIPSPSNSRKSKKKSKIEDTSSSVDPIIPTDEDEPSS